MPIGSVLIGLALAVIVLPFVLSPFLRQEGGRVERGGEPAAPKPAGKDALLALRDLDFDFRTGKLTEDDYVPLRAQLVAQAAVAAQAQTPAKPSSRAPVETVDDRIEAAVRSARENRKAGAAMACPHCQTGVKPGDKFCSRCGQALSRACPDCRAIVRTDDRFCGRCGAALASQATHAP